MLRSESCDHCYFRAGDECHRYPRQWRQHNLASWPYIVGTSDWCGEYKQKETENTNDTTS